MRRYTGQKLWVALTVLLLATPAAAADPPARMLHFRSNVVVEADGRAAQTAHFEIAVSNDAAARSEAQQAFTYTDGIETVELVEGYTLKPDGRRLPVLPGAVRIQLAPGTPNIPEYTARKQVVAVLPDVAGGDVLAITWRRTILHPIFPGQFAFTGYYLRSIPWDDMETSISVPAGVALNTEAFGPEHQEADEAGRQVHHWHWSAPAVANDPAVLAPIDRVPRFFASTFADWTTFSREYAALVAPKAEVTPRIQALADQLASGATDRRDEARRIYEYVSRHVRWVAIYVGDGAFVPHPADEVLANGYGDCKDQAVLLVTLLRARGIAAEPVLINLGPTYTLSGPPTFTAFNHMIAYMPEWKLYADTTAGGAPFGTLQSPEYGKPVLHVTPEGASPGRIAVMPPDLASERLRTTMQLHPDGRITGESVTDASGPYATSLRQFANQVMAQGAERAGAERLRVLNQPGEGAISPEPLDPIGPGYRVSAHFTLNAQPDLLDGESLLMPTGMRLLQRPGDGLIGPLHTGNLPTSEPTPCYAGLQDEELSLALPPGYRPVRLPRARRVDNDAFTYESQWSLEDDTLRVTRHFVSRVDQPLCTGSLRAAAAKAFEEIRRDQNARVDLEKAG